MVKDRFHYFIKKMVTQLASNSIRHVAIPSRLIAFLMFYFFLFAPLFAQEIKVTAEIEQDTSYENQPIKGIITITHSKEFPIDSSNFLLDEKKLDVELTKEIQIDPSDPLTLSIYTFTLPSQPQGLYALPKISIKIGQKNYQSAISSYNVQSRTKKEIPQTSSQNQTSSPNTSTPSLPNISTPSLLLKSSIEGNSPLYPGQKTVFAYFYYFNGNINLTTETLPLLNAEGFIKIGEKEFKDYLENNLSVRKISQEVEAIKPGTYSFGSSLIEGYAYKEGAGGQLSYTSGKLSSKTTPITVTVLPFPEKNQPASFNGAVGSFNFHSELASSKTMKVGDEISLKLHISGKSNLKNVKAPDLCCQPGFSGFFELNDLPPQESIENHTKIMTIKLKPLNQEIKEIPSIEFSYFNPETSLYTILKSSPIPISVSPATKNQIHKQTPQTQIQSPKEKEKKFLEPIPNPIEIETILPLSTNDLYNRFFGSWWAIGIAPFAAALLIYQLHLKNYLTWMQSQKPLENSDSIFKRAFAQKNQGKCNFELLKTAFKLALIEQKLLPPADIDGESLEPHGVAKEVNVFWSTVDEKRFSKNQRYDCEEIYLLAQDLMKKIKEASNERSI